MIASTVRFVVPALLALAGCSHTTGSLQARSARALGCQQPDALRVSGYQAGDPQQNIPERWMISGCGGAYSCASFLMSSGEPAHTECQQAERQAVQRARPADTGQNEAPQSDLKQSDPWQRSPADRLAQASVQQVAYTTRCSADSMQISERQVEGSTHIYTVHACGQTYRCLTQVARSALEDRTRCREVMGSEPLFVSEVGPVIGAHTGPGLLGVGGVPSHCLRESQGE